MLTWRCNLRCRMCPVWGDRGLCRRDGYVDDERLDVQSVQRFLDGPRRPRTVTLSGGEPLLSPLCLPLARALTDDGHRVCLTTNATLLASVPADELAIFHQINVSLDGPPMVLERLGRGGEATLDAVLDGLRHVVASRRGQRPGLRLLTVITPEGAGHLSEMLETFDAAGIPFDSLLFQHQMALTEGAAAAQQRTLGELAGPGLSYWECLVDGGGSIDADALHDELADIQTRYPRVVLSAPFDREAMRAYYGDPAWTAPQLADACPALRRDLTVSPAGDVWLCPGHPLGNVFEDALDDVLAGDGARSLREAVEAHGVFPGCRACFSLYNYREWP